jgi:hypothetical protein
MIFLLVECYQDVSIVKVALVSLDNGIFVGLSTVP